MKTLLVAINSKYIHSNLAVYSLKAYSRESGADIEIAEFTINQYVDSICSEIYKKKPDVLAFSCYIWNIGYVCEVAAEIHKLLPDTQIWFGGPEVTYDSESVILKNKCIKGVMTGEGEETFSELTRAYAEEYKVGKREVRDEELLKIRGISFRKADGQIITTMRRPLIDMDTLNFVYEDISRFENRIIYYESSRGCPFGCSYCLSSIERSVRFRSLEKVKPELKFLLEKNVPQIKFVDRTFNCNHERTKELLKFILENDNGVTNFHFEAAADLLDEEEIEIMAAMRPGLIQLEIGVQSTNPVTIKEIDRVMDFEKVSSVVRKINAAGNIHQHLDLIAGLPSEDYNTFIKSFNDVYSLRPEQLQLGFLKVLKGSKMQRNEEIYGIVHTDRPPYEILYTNWMSYDDILALKNIEEVVELYYNSGQYRNTIEHLIKQFESPFHMYRALAEYYEKNELFDVKHSRITRYNILKAFMSGVTGGDESLFEQILVFDLYLRENLKTRPAFATDITDNKADLREFYNVYAGSRKNVHIEVFSHDIAEICNIRFMRAERNNDSVISETNAFVSTGTVVMFDYDDRNPLNYEAAVYRLEV